MFHALCIPTEMSLAAEHLSTLLKRMRFEYDYARTYAIHAQKKLFSPLAPPHPFLSSVGAYHHWCRSRYGAWVTRRPRAGVHHAFPSTLDTGPTTTSTVRPHDR